MGNLTIIRLVVVFSTNVFPLLHHSVVPIIIIIIIMRQTAACVTVCVCVCVYHYKRKRCPYEQAHYTPLLMLWRGAGTRLRRSNSDVYVVIIFVFFPLRVLFRFTVFAACGPPPSVPLSVCAWMRACELCTHTRTGYCVRTEWMRCVRALAL